MATKESTKADDIRAQALAEDATASGKVGPEASGQKSAATLEEAMVMQDRLAREANGTTEDTEEPAVEDE
jgi:hypothetical protein